MWDSGVTQRGVDDVNAMGLNADRRATVPARLGRAAIAAFLAVPYISILLTPATPVSARFALGALSCLAALAPHAGLLLFAACAPIAAAIPGLFNVSLATPFGEILLLSTTVGWWTGAAVRAEPLPRSTARWALLLGVIGVASAAVQLVPVYLRVADSTHWWSGISRLIAGELYSNSPLDLDFIRQAIDLAASLALFVACAATVRTNAEHGLTRMAVVGFTAAAAINLLRPLTAAVASGDVRAWLEANAALRINVFYADTNAAGSVFAMATLLALGLAAAARQLRWTLPILLLVGALWLTGSRAAMGALFTCAALWSVMQQWRRPAPRIRVAATLLALALCAGTTYVFWPATRNVTTSRALLVRTEMAAASFRMWKTAPVFGVGLGRYRDRSPQFMGEGVRSFYTAENAHNNFLQIMAELGLVGLWAFVAVVAGAARPAPRSDQLHRGLLWGTIAFLLTCLVSHPLLVPDAAVAFWLVLGILAGTRASVEAPRRTRVLSTVALTVLVLTLPLRLVSAQREASLEHVYRGFSETWIRDLEGEPYRTLLDSSGTVYIEANDRFIAIPLRSTEGLLRVAVTLDGRLVDDVAVPADRWTYLRFLVPRASDGRRFRALGLEPRAAEGTRAGLRVGRARLY